MNFIVATDLNFAIGNKGKLLTHLPEDLKNFKKKTLNKVVIMGRKTLESLPGSKPLPDRTNIILTRDKNYHNDEVIVAHSTDELFEIVKEYPDDHLFVTGGGEIYKLLMPYCNYGYITKIHTKLNADTYLEDLDDMPNWHKIWESEEKKHNDITFTFTKYQNTNCLPMK